MKPDYPTRERAHDLKVRVLGAPSLQLMAQWLAESGCDLTQWDQCCEVLIARGVRPSAVKELDLVITRARVIRHATA